MTNKYYKYRSISLADDGEISEETLRYVLYPIQTSHFYLPTRKELNDPSEGLLDNNIMSQVNSFLTGVTGFGERQDLTKQIILNAKAIPTSINSTGIFSLTKNPTDELMWAHYANGHCGIAIEYDLEGLTRFAPNTHLHHFPIIYAQTPPSIGINDIEASKLMRNMLGYKSIGWTYESEYRVLVDNVNGTFPHDYQAIKSITFGIKLKSSIRKKIIALTKHRVPTFYEIKTDGRSYGFQQVLMESNVLPKPTSCIDEINWEELIGHLGIDIQPIIKSSIIGRCRKDIHFKEFVSVDMSTNKPNHVFFQYKVHHEHKILSGQNLVKEYISLS